MPIVARPDGVSIHAPAGGATYHICTKLCRCGVSIHAPAGGATELPKLNRDFIEVSIHAPAGGATRIVPDVRYA